MKMFQSTVPAHSNYSDDGRHTIGEIAAFARGRGFAFVAMSEHSDSLDGEKFKRLREACQDASAADCLMIPGIEFTLLRRKPRV